jgi:hypothetical protein
MLLIVLLIYIGRAFYMLANQHNKNGWVFTVLGIVAFFGGLILGGVILAIAFELLSETSIGEFSDNTIGYMAMPFGLIACWLTHLFLRRRWKTAAPQNNSNDILDSGL